MSIPGALLPHIVEQGLVSSLLPRSPQLQELSGPVRIEKVQQKNLPRPPLPHKKGVKGRHLSGICQPRGQLPGWQDHFLGFSDQRCILRTPNPCSAKTMLKLPEAGNSRPYQDPKPCFQGVCESDGLFWYNPGPLHIGHNTRASATIQSEAPLIKPTQQVWGKSAKDPGEHDDYTGQLNAIWGHHRVGPREQGILYISLPDSQEK